MIFIERSYQFSLKRIAVFCILGDHHLKNLFIFFWVLFPTKTLKELTLRLVLP